MLVAEGTRDAHMLRASAARERRMMDHLRRLGRTRRLHEYTNEEDPLAAFQVNTEDRRIRDITDTAGTQACYKKFCTIGTSLA